MRLWSLVLTGVACLAIARTAETSTAFSVAEAISGWFLRLRGHILAFILSGTEYRFLPPISDVLADLVVGRPLNKRSYGISDVPQPHFVAFGPGSVLPDFSGPFSVDVVYRNKRWGKSVYYAVWVGYYENRRIAVGVDAHTTYHDICRFLANSDPEFAGEQLLTKMRQALHGALSAYEHTAQALVMHILLPCEHYFFWESEALAGLLGRTRYIFGMALYYWLDWALRWNTLRALFFLRSIKQPPAAAAATKRHALLPHTRLTYGLYLIDALELLALPSPARITRAFVLVASTPLQPVLWQSVYLGHRLALLRRCVAGAQHK